MESARTETLKHIEVVSYIMSLLMSELIDKMESHDLSKLETPEVEVFEEFTPLLKQSTYGSTEYYEMLDKMKVAIYNHYKENRHHPEFHKQGIKGMNLMDILEMFCDWKAATLRHENGDIFKSIKHNKERFNYSDDLESIFNNTANWLEGNMEKS